MKKLNSELQNQIECEIDITYGQDIAEHNSVLYVTSICDKYNVQNKLYHEKRYCCTDYMILKTTGYLSLSNTEKFIKESGLPISINYHNGIFITDYDNTYW